MVTILPASAALAVPLIVCVAIVEVTPGLVIVTTGATVSSVSTTGLLVPVLPAASVSSATIEWAPSPDSVTLVLHAPLAPTVAVPIWLVTPLAVSNSVTVLPIAHRPRSPPRRSSGSPRWRSLTRC